MSTSQNFCSQYPVPVVSHSRPPASAGDPSTLAGGSDSVSCGVTASFPWVLVRTLLCVCPPRVESLFPPVMLKSCSQIPLAFKFWFSEDSFSCCQTPRLGSLTWGSEPSLQWVDFCGVTVQFVSRPPSDYGIWFHCDWALPTISLQLLLCFGVSFLVSSSVFLLRIVQQLVVLLVLSQERVSACPSTPPCWTNPEAWNVNHWDFRGSPEQSFSSWSLVLWSQNWVWIPALPCSNFPSVKWGIADWLTWREDTWRITDKLQISYSINL